MSIRNRRTGCISTESTIARRGQAGEAAEHVNALEIFQQSDAFGTLGVLSPLQRGRIPHRDGDQRGRGDVFKLAEVD
jgi:hypothetical protein